MVVSRAGHCFRRSSATILVDEGADITALKRHGGWRSTAVAEGYIDNSIKNKMNTADKLMNSIQCASTSAAPQQFFCDTVQEEPTHIMSNEEHTNTTYTSSMVKENLPTINLTNCSHFTFNFVTKND